MAVSYSRSQMVVSVTIISIIILLTSTVVDATKVRGAKDNDKAQQQQQRGRHLNMQEECTLTLQDVEYYYEPDLPEFDAPGAGGSIEVRRQLAKKSDAAPKSVSKWCCELSSSDAAATGMNFVYVNGLSEGFYSNHSVAPGDSTLLVDASLDPDTMEMTVTSEATAKVGKKGHKGHKKGRRMRLLVAEEDEDAIEDDDEEEDRRHGRRLAAVGTKRVLVVRVQANDVATTSSEDILRADVFDTNNLSLRTQYAACSLNQLQMVPATGTNPVTQQPYNNGVTTMPVNLNARGASNDVVRNAVVNRLGGKPANVDHVMLCIPPGTAGGWIAYAYVNSWLSVYNDEWCRSLSAQLHELGHNFNLDHSGEGTELYGDQSGMMGYSYFNFNAPRMCFNPAKTWQLGWFEATGEVTEWNRAFGSRTYALVGVGRPAKQAGIFVIVKIPNGAFDLYVGYNRNTGSNAGVVEDPNEVTIVSRAAGTGFAPSLKVAALVVGGSYTVPNYLGSGTPLTIRFSSSELLGTDAIGQANVVVSHLPALNQCGSKATFNFKILTDNFADETSWTLRLGQTVVASRTLGSYKSAGTSVTTEVCLGPGTYTFTISDSYGDGICCNEGNGKYEGYVNGDLVFNGGRFGSAETKTFTVGRCTAPDAIDFSMQIRTDTYPDETSWELYDLLNGVATSKVASGGGYRLQNALLPAEQFCIKRWSSSGDRKCYRLRLRDTFGDGMCCKEGDGFYKAVVGSPADPKSLPITGAPTGSLEEKTFCAL